MASPDCWGRGIRLLLEIPALWFPPGSAGLLISIGQTPRPLSALAQHPPATVPRVRGRKPAAKGGERAGHPGAAHFPSRDPHHCPKALGSLGRGEAQTGWLAARRTKRLDRAEPQSLARSRNHILALTDRARALSRQQDQRRGKRGTA